MDKSKRKHSIGKVYKPQGAHYWGMVFVIGIILVHFMIMSSIPLEDSDAWFFNCFFIPFYALVIFVIYVQIAQTNISLHEDGIEYRQGSSRLFVEWHDMSHLGRRSQGKSSSYGIYLTHKIKPEATNIIDKLFYGWASNYIQLSAIVSVPSRWASFWKGSVVDLDKFADTDFGYELKQYAPHLFEKGKL